jgi:thiamine biosynthesis lipoprotein
MSDRRLFIPADLDAAALRASRIDAPVRTLAGETMGTGWMARFAASATITNADVVAALEAAFAETIAALSGWERTSALSLYNAAPAGEQRMLPEPLVIVLARALAIAERSGGAFNPALAEAVDRLGFGPSGADEAVADVSFARDASAARASDPWRRINLDPETRRATQPGGVKLDLSSIGKGYAVDLCAARLGALGVGSFLMEIGGEFVGQGVKPDGQPWWVELQLSDLDPAPGEPARTFAALSGLAVATSGDFVRRRKAGGASISHIIDGRTGARLDGALSGVAVFHARCMDADGWATALYVLGAEAGVALADAEGLAAVFAVREASGARCVLSAKAREMLE